MKKITVFAAGSRGDIQPCVALARGLQQAGFQVRLAAPADFGDFVRQHSVDFYPLRGDVQQIMASDTGRRFMQTGGGNPLKSIRVIRSMIAPVVLQMAQDVFSACLDAEALVCLGVFSAFGQAITEVLGIPILHVEPTPLLPSRSFPAPSWPVQRNLGGLHNVISGRAMLHVVWLWYLPFLKEFRRWLGLPVASASHFYRVLRSEPLLGAYSPSIIPHPSDWPNNVHVTGYFFLDPPTGWQPPAELETFLESGDPPVYIGFGSMAGQDPQRLASLVTQALARTGQRGLLLTGWGGMRPEARSRDIYVLDAAPHNWLFPRMAAVVHHGGAGTTAESLRAGVPSVILPFVFDQPFWGARVRALGLGPEPISLKRLTTERLTHAIREAVTNVGMRQRAAHIGEVIRAEDGVNRAVEIIRHRLG